MKKCLQFAAFAAILSLPMQAQEKLVVTGTGGNATTVEISKITEITFQGNAMLVATADGQLSFPTNDIDNIAFDLSMSGADNISASLSDNLTISTNKGMVTATTADGAKIALDIYDIKGLCHMSLRAEGSVSADTSKLTNGIYIIKINDKIVKYIR